MRAPASIPHLFRSLSPQRAACLALLAPVFALAQGTAARAAANPWAGAADPAQVEVPTTRLAHHGLIPRPPLPDAAASPWQWREANEAVAAFPRGHADIVAWEGRQAAPQHVTAPAPVAVPNASTGQSHGRQGHRSDKAAAPPSMHQHHHGAPGGQP